MAKVIMPQCIAEYEVGHDMCDGEADGATKNDRDPCKWRDRCVGLMHHCSAIGKSIEETELVDFKCKGAGEDEEHWAVPAGRPKEFVQLCDKLVVKYGVKKGKATITPGSESKEDGRKNLRPAKKTQQAASKALTAKKMERRDQLRELFEHLMAQLAEQLPGFKFAPPKEAVAPGKLHVVDRIDSSGYASIYCKTAKGRDKPLLLAKFKPRTMTVDIELPLGPGDYNGIGKVTLKRLDPKPIIDGMFKSIIKKLDVEGCALAAEAIGKLVAHGKIELPEA